MQKILSPLRRCVQDYDMIEEGDRIAVGLSGGKDSMLLLHCLNLLSKFYPKRFTIEAITVDMGFPDADFSPIGDYCTREGIPHTIKHTELAELIFDVRKESNPCSLCAKMRRGILDDAAKELGISKLALGHNFDDAVETFLMCQIYEGRISCFSPVTYLDRSGMTVIRPLLYVPEKTVRAYAAKAELPIAKNPCPSNGSSKRQEIKEFVDEMELRWPGYKQRIFGSMQRLPLDGWQMKR